MRNVICFLLITLPLLFVPANAQDNGKPQPVAAVAAPKIPDAGALKPVVASIESQNAILKAERDLNNVKSDMADIVQQFQNLQRTADQLNPRYKADQEKEKALDSAVSAALDAAYKSNGLTKDKYSFDPANFTFTPKPEKPAEAKNVEQAAVAPAK